MTSPVAVANHSGIAVASDTASLCELSIDPNLRRLIEKAEDLGKQTF